MKSVIVLAIVFLVTVTAPLDSAAQSENHIRLRAGISTLTGLIGIEYQMSKVSITAGYLGTNDDFDGNSNPILIGGVRYAFQPEGRSPFLGVSFVTNQTNEVDVDLSDDWDLDISGGTGHCLDMLAGYRFPIGEKWDFTAGAGYAIKVSGDGDNVGALDIAFGYAIK